MSVFSLDFNVFMSREDEQNSVSERFEHDN